MVALGHPAERVALYIGSCSEAQRREAEEKQRICSTFSMAREGLDIARLDTIILLSPSSSIEQAVGRVLRPNPDKKTPLVLDVVDPFSLFHTMAQKRLRFYQKSTYEVQDVTHEWAPTDARLYG